MNNYQKNKERIINKAIDFQLSQNNISYYDLYLIQNYFSKQAKRYGLIKEFKENGII